LNIDGDGSRGGRGDDDDIDYDDFDDSNDDDDDSDISLCRISQETFQTSPSDQSTVIKCILLHLRLKMTHLMV